ncbi:unnamed protein product, partial [Prunus brigantina]
MGSFAVNLGNGQTLDAKLWGLFFGLKLAAAKGVDGLSIEMDSMTDGFFFFFAGPDGLGFDCTAAQNEIGYSLEV